MQRKIPNDRLPQTLKDAVEVTRTLNIRYLGIDALCILKDSIVDKSRKVQNVGRVYQNATATIIAGASRSASRAF